MMRNRFLLLFILSLFVFLTACSAEQHQTESTTPAVQTATTATKESRQPTIVTTEPKPAEAPQEQPQDEQNRPLQMTIGGTSVTVVWEDNDAVQALKELCREQPLTIAMSMYGGFEQVGSIGSALPQDDVQTTTSAGDIVLYSGNQMVVFYGSNTWAYTRLGHISDKTTEELTQLLSNDTVTITLTY